MKNIIRKTIGATLLTGTLLVTNTIRAQNIVVTERPTSSMGTISEFNPETMIVKTETGTEPVRYGYSKTTTYVDEAGAPVSITTIKSGVPVTVYYTKSGDTLLVSKVVVRKTVVTPESVIEQKNTTTTTTETK